MTVEMPVCPHLKAFKEDGGVNTFRVIQRYAARALQGRAEITYPHCSICTSEGGNDEAGIQLFACMECVSVRCFPAHMKKHLESSQHSLATDLLLGSIYCHKCSDIVYDDDLTLVFKKERDVVNPSFGKNTKGQKRKLLEVSKWSPSPKQAGLIVKSSKGCGVVEAPNLLGLRGLNNLGNTCFMNCILQALVHNPVVQKYFLGDKHNAKFCLKKKEGASCLACELDTIISQMFSGDPKPISPHELLHAVWTSADHLAGYEMQDAHEFFISFINTIHNHLEPSEGHGEHCNCIMHKSFGGLLRSDLTCTNCGAISTKSEPFFDISLHLSRSGDDGANGSGSKSETIWDCFERFTGEERLGEGDKIFCSRCQMNAECSKQLSITSLPLVLCVHLKRFERGVGIQKGSAKIDSFVEFPATDLDLTPYTSTVIERGRNGDTVHLTSAGENLYDLFAVANHQGSMDNGHYTCYVRHGKNWYFIEDSRVRRVPLDKVLSSQGYVLFFIRKNVTFCDSKADEAEVQGEDSSSGSSRSESDDESSS